MRQSLSTMRVLWLAITLSSVVFVVILRGGAIPSTPPDPVIVVGLGVAAIVDLAVSVILPAQVLGMALKRLSTQIVEQADTEAEVAFREAAPKKRSFTDPKAAQRTIVLAVQSPFILGLALTESVALFGLVLGRLGAPLVQIAPFFVAAWVAFALRFPTEAKIARAVKKHLDMDLPPG